MSNTAKPFDSSLIIVELFKLHSIMNHMKYRKSHPSSASKMTIFAASERLSLNNEVRKYMKHVLRLMFKKYQVIQEKP
jgi:uncharacterized membrane protein